jgi:hypothetical protein
MSGQALVFLMNTEGMVLKMESLGGMNTYRPAADCLARNIAEILPSESVKNLIPTLQTAYKSGPAARPYMFNYTLEDPYTLENVRYIARITYYGPDTLLVVSQRQD